MFKIIETLKYNKDFKKLVLSVVLNIGVDVLKDTVTASQYADIKKLQKIIIGGTIVYSLLQS